MVITVITIKIFTFRATIIIIIMMFSRGKSSSVIYMYVLYIVNLHIITKKGSVISILLTLIISQQ